MISKSEEEHVRLAGLRGETFRLSREERDHIAGHALDSIKALGSALAADIGSERTLVAAASDHARKVAALSNLLGDIGWEREGTNESADQHVPPHKPLPRTRTWQLGELFPVAQLRPWLEEWQRQDNEALVEVERALEVGELETPPDGMGRTVVSEMERFGKLRQAIADAQTKLGTGAILLARIEKWMACKEN